MRKKVAERRNTLIDGYGGKCVCCGETTREFLTLEHINGGGRAHRRSLGGSKAVYQDVIDRGFPPEFTLLCMNCNFAKRFGRKCPHETCTSTIEALVEALTDLLESIGALDECDCGGSDMCSVCNAHAALKLAGVK
ncbi:MAG: hypothetical protein WC455_31325 [Dehalococcoidia bacterium]|jgi:hypothetical protein